MKRKNKKQKKQNIIQRAFTLEKEAFEEIGFTLTKEDFLNYLKAIPHGGAYFCKLLCNAVSNHFRKEDANRQKLALVNYRRKILLVEPYLQKELFELFTAFPTYKYQMYLTKPEDIQIVKYEICVKDTDTGRIYLGVIYTIRLKRTANQTLTYDEREAFCKDWNYFYKRKANRDSLFFTPQALRNYRPVMYAGYELVKMPFHLENDMALYLRVAVNINAI